MKTKAKTWLILAIIAAIAIAIAFICTQVQPNKAFAEEVNAEQSDGFIISDDAENIAATFVFTKLSDTECNVRITNKTVATKAVIPSVGEIDGKKYKVTEIANSGFVSSSKLIRVSLPSTIKKIGSSAFANCAKLKRVNLANVEEIGNNAFYRCPELAEIVIPKSTQKIGTYIFRSNDTKVRVRANEAGANWASLWNSSNANQEVEYGSTYVQPLELEPIYNTDSSAYIRTSSARSADEIIGYSIGSGQPRSDEYYSSIEYGEFSDDEDGCIFIPAQYNGVDILELQDRAFEGANFTHLIIEYSERDLIIGSSAFELTSGESIIINRPIKYFDDTIEIFNISLVQTIFLPNNITTIVGSMFWGCDELSNIFFIEPKEQSREQLISLIDEFKQNNEEGKVYLHSSIISIGDCAFLSTTAITELHLNDTIQYVGFYILDGWNEDTQKVYVHNQKKIRDWDNQWNGDFNNVEYDKYFYTITFNLDGGEFVEENDRPMDIELGTAIGALPEVKKEGNDFIAWYKDDVKITAETIYEYEYDIEVKAKWKGIECTVYFEFEGGEGTTDYIKVKYNDFLPKVEAPTRTGYDFRGYYTEQNGKGTLYYLSDMESPYTVKITEDITIFAYWEPKTYNVYLYSGYGDNSMLYSITVTYGEYLRYERKPDERRGYAFTGYYDGMDSDATRYYDENMNGITKWEKTEDGELYAHWELIVYKIDYEIRNKDNSIFPSGYYSPNPDTYTILDVQYRGYVPVSVDSVGYRITWENQIIANSIGNITIYGEAETITYEITYDYSNWKGASFVNNNPTTYTVEDEVVFETVNSDNHTLVWSPTKIEKGTYGNITATLVVTKTLTSSTSTYTANLCDNELIYLPQKFANGCVITISSNVKSVMIVGQTGATYSIRLVINSDSDNFVLLLKDVVINAPAKYHAITAKEDKALTLYTYGEVKIIGGKGSSSAGYDAIHCGTLYLNAANQLYIKGGDGDQNPVGSGYAGGYGIYVAKNCVYINCGNVTIVGGNGGNGCNETDRFGFYIYQGGAGGQPFGGTDKITLYIYFPVIYTVSYSAGENGGIGIIYDPTLPFPVLPDYSIITNPDLPPGIPPILI